MINYLQSLQSLLRDYNDSFYSPNNLYWLNSKDIIFIYKQIKYQLHDNGNCISLWEVSENGKIKNLHNVPVMLSSTDTFMFTYIKFNILITSGQLSIFDFLDSGVV